MANFNKVFLMGRLTRDPTLRYTPGGTAVADISIAVNRVISSPEGDKREETVFVEVVFWGKRAEVACQYLKKASPVFIEGRLSMDNWETPDGQKRSRLRVTCENFQFIGRGPERSAPAVASPPAAVEETASETLPAPPVDDLPF